MGVRRNDVSNKERVTEHMITNKLIPRMVLGRRRLEWFVNSSEGVSNWVCPRNLSVFAKIRSTRPMIENGVKKRR